MSGVDDVDLDRLADYAAGLLDPVQAAEVERLLASEPAWAQTLAALEAAQPRVHAALAGLADPPVPDDVVARLDAALPQPDRGAEVVDLGAERRHRRRWPAFAAGVTAAAAVAAVVVGGLHLVRGTELYGTSSSGSGAERNAGPASAPHADYQAQQPLILATGTDYTPQTVTSFATANKERALAPRPQLPSAAGAAGEKNARSPLTRLTGPAELQTCLNLVAMAYSGTPTVVDYASYQGRPAVVVVLSGSGAGEVVVVGPDCGLPAAGTDQIYAAPVR